MRRRPENHLVGIWRHPVGGWEISYKKDGKKHSEYRKDETEARLRADYWKAQLENPPEDSQEAEHPVHYWERQLRKIAEMALANPGDKDIANTCKAVATAATAALRTAKYISAPVGIASPDGAPVSGEIENFTTEQLKSLVDGKASD